MVMNRQLENSRTQIDVAKCYGRLSFWIPSDRRDEFEKKYQEEAVPVLREMGLVEAGAHGRETVGEVFSRLFEVVSPAEVEEMRRVFQRDSGWQEVLEILGEMFHTGESGIAIRYRFSIYSAPTLLVEGIAAGKGRGYWRTYDAADGLAENFVGTVCRDGEGNIWFGTESGVSRYDGESFTTFTTQDGLAHNSVYGIFPDREGCIWFSTMGGGVSRYDGVAFTTYTTLDGLAHNRILPISQDFDGNLWFGASSFDPAVGGTSRYDGREFITFTTDDGLAQNTVASIFQDSKGYLWFGTGGLTFEGGGVSRYDGENFTTFTTDDGLAHNTVASIFQDCEGYLWFGTNGGGVSRYDGESFTTFTTDDGLAHNCVGSIVQDSGGNLWFSTFGGGVSCYDGETFRTFSFGDGLAHTWVSSSCMDLGGCLWFSTLGGGVSRYDGETFRTFTSSDALVGISISGTIQDLNGNLWFSTLGEGVSRYDGSSFFNFSTRYGLTGNTVRCIFQDRKGTVWVGTYDGFISCYDGQTWLSFGPEDGLPDCPLFSIEEDREGNLWFGTQGGGVSRYDGQVFSTLTTKDGLVHDEVRSVLQDSKGYLWFGTMGGGVSRYDGQTWKTFTASDGLGNDCVQEGATFEDREGRIWIGTRGGGISLYDGEKFQTFTTEDGLAHNVIWAITQDRKGHIWIATAGGVSQYDGKVFQTLSKEDGLPTDAIWSVFEDREGRIWIGSTSGLTLYSPPTAAPPSVFLDAMVADRRYEEAEEISISESAGLAIFEFHGTSLKTRQDAMVYRYRLKGYDEEWKNTRQRRVEYENLPIGPYRFEVVAVDRDLVYSEEPAGIDLSITADPRDEQIDELEVRVRERTRELEETHQKLQEIQAQLIGELEEELQTAHEMQMRLMPTESPKIEGIDISGRCVPATHVGGDFFQYFSLSRNQLAVALADVTGHAMEAAIPVVMFSGILKTEMRFEESIEQLFANLNQTLFDTLDRRTFVCFTMGELDLENLTFRLSNGGCPYPYHFRAATGELVELQADAYPLGIRAGAEYRAVEVRLQPGDRVVFCSDGIIEADNALGEQFGFESTAEVLLRVCEEDLSAESTLDRIFHAVGEFKGDVPQSDDMTCVVMRIEKR